MRAVTRSASCALVCVALGCSSTPVAPVPAVDAAADGAVAADTPAVTPDTASPADVAPAVDAAAPDAGPADDTQAPTDLPVPTDLPPPDDAPPTDDTGFLDASVPEDAVGMDTPGTDTPGTDTPGMDVRATDVPGDAPADVPAPDAGGPRTFDWVGIVGTGQSLSVGARGTPVISTTQPFNNRKLLDTSTPALYAGTDHVTLVPLVEPIRGSTPGLPGGPYPNNIGGETPHTAMGSQVTALVMAAMGHDYVTLHSVVGQGGQSITVIQRGGTGNAFASSLYEAHAFNTLATAAGRTFGYGAVVLTHGEADSARATYEADIYRLFTDYNTELRAITGQGTAIPLILSQQSTIPGAPGVQSVSTQAAWRLGVDHPGEVICAGPKYQYTYASDHLHLDAYGYRRLGIKYGEVYYETVVQHHPWQPLQPLAVHRAGRTLTVDFNVPMGPLAWEESLAPAHQTAFTPWAHGRGFEVADATGPLTIDSVAIAGSSVVITLATAPPATDPTLVLRYAMTQDGTGDQGGLVTGRRGQLRDSDPLVGIDHETVACMVTHGSSTVTAATHGALARRGGHDLVEGSGLAAGTVAVDPPAGDTLVLSAPWTGPSGTVSLGFHSDQRNYCVQFTLSVP